MPGGGVRAAAEVLLPRPLLPLPPLLPLLPLLQPPLPLAGCCRRCCRRCCHRCCCHRCGCALFSLCTLLHMVKASSACQQSAVFGFQIQLQNPPALKSNC
jgi:hypothetical protein